MKIGKRRQSRQPHNTPVGTVVPAVGLNQAHAERALALGAPPEAATPPGRAAPVTPQSEAHLKRAGKILIGCARRAGMGPIRVVNEATRVLLRRAARPRSAVDEPIEPIVEAAAEAADLLGLDANEARRAAELAALAQREPDAFAARDDALDRVAPPLTEPAGARRRRRPLRELRSLASVAVREIADDIGVRPGGSAQQVHDAVCAAASRDLSPFGAIRDTALARIPAATHAGEDLIRAARDVVRGAVAASSRLKITRRAAAAIAAYHAVDAAGTVGRHAADGAYRALTTWDPREPAARSTRRARATR